MDQACSFVAAKDTCYQTTIIANPLRVFVVIIHADILTALTHICNLRNMAGIQFAFNNNSQLARSILTQILMHIHFEAYKILPDVCYFDFSACLNKTKNA